MQDDLLDLLHETAFDPDPVDLDDIRRDAHHLRRNRRAAALGGAAGVAALVATAILTVAGSPESPVIGPAPSPSAAMPERLDTDVIEVLAATQTDDRTLKGHVVTDQDGLESVWEMFDAGSLAPGLPDGAGALVVAADGCHALHGVTGVEIRDSIGIVLVEEDPRVGRAGCDRTVFAVAIPAAIADRLTGTDAAVQTASTGNSPPDQGEEPAVWW